MAELRVNTNESGTVNIPGAKNQPNVLHIGPGATVDASALVFNTKGENPSYAARVNGFQSTNNFINSTIRFQVPDNDISKYSVKIHEERTPEGETKFSDVYSRSHVTLYKTGPDGKQEAVTTVRLKDVDRDGIKGGNKDYANTIQIQTADGKVHGVKEPEIKQYQSHGDMIDPPPYVVKSADLKIDGDNKTNPITPEILSKAQEAVAPKPPGEVNPVPPTALMNQPAPQPSVSPTR